MALRGVMVITKLGPLSAPPSEISMVALRSGLVKTSKLVLPRLAEIRLQPLRWYWSKKKLYEALVSRPTSKAKRPTQLSPAPNMSDCS